MENKPFKSYFEGLRIYSLLQNFACFHILIKSTDYSRIPKANPKPILTEKNYFSYYLQSNTGATVLNRLQDLRFMAHMKSLQKTTENPTRKYYQFY